MAETSQDFLNRITGLTQQLGTSTLPTGQDILRELSARVGDFAPQFQELRGAEQAATAAPAAVFGDFAQRFGGGAGAGPSAFRTLQSAMEERGRQFGTADVLRDILGQQQGTLGGIAENVLGQAQLGRQNILDQISSLMPLYQTQAQREEAARGRAANRLDFEKLFQMFGGGGGMADPSTAGTGMASVPGMGVTQGDFFTNRAFDRVKALANPDIFQRLSPESRQVPGQIIGGGGGGGGFNFLQGLGRMNPLTNILNIPSDIGQGFQGIRNLFR